MLFLRGVLLYRVWGSVIDLLGFYDVGEFMTFRANFCGMIGGGVDLIAPRLGDKYQTVYEDRISAGVFGVGFSEIRELFWKLVSDVQCMGIFGAPPPFIYVRGLWSYGVFLRLLFEEGDLSEEEYYPMALMWLRWLPKLTVPHAIVWFEGGYDLFGADRADFVREICEEFLRGFEVAEIPVIRIPTHEDLGISLEEWYTFCLVEIDRLICAELPI